jgi:hypothetical protein
VTTDVDLLVGEADLERALVALSSIGYEASTDPSERRFRREHHHLHLFHPQALPLELHFHAYKGFGRILPSEPLVARRLEVPNLRAIGVLAPEDELVFLSVHAAAHRFGRLAWLYDLRLLIDVMTEPQLELSVARAREWGYARSLAFAASLLVELFGVEPGRLRPLLPLGRFRRRIARRFVAEPQTPLKRSATRFVYSTALCDSLRATTTYALGASRGYVRRAVGLE